MNDPDSLATAVRDLTFEGSPNDVIAHLWSSTEVPAGVILYRWRDHLILDQAHAVLDGRFSTRVAEALLTGARNEEWMTHAIGRPRLGVVTFRHLLADPRRAWSLFRQISSSRHAAAHSERPCGPMRALSHTPETALRFDAVGPQQMRQLRCWRDEHAPESTLTVVLTAVIARALTRSGLSIDPRLHLLTDGRRYSPRARRFSGNFTVGLNFDFRPPHDPQDLTRRLSEALAAGRPLLAMSAISVMTRLAQWSLIPDETADLDRAILSVSDLGRAAVEDAPWIGTPSRCRYFGVTNAYGRRGIAVLMVRIGETQNFSVTFDPSAHPTQAVEAAVSAIARDPLHFLTSEGNRS